LEASFPWRTAVASEATAAAAAAALRTQGSRAEPPTKAEAAAAGRRGLTPDPSGREQASKNEHFYNRLSSLKTFVMGEREEKYFYYHV